MKERKGLRQTVRKLCSLGSEEVLFPSTGHFHFVLYLNFICRHTYLINFKISHKVSDCCCIGDHADIHNDNDDDSDDKYANID
jgi:hypothetical protein